jgi:hypothetical protein
MYARFGAPTLLLAVIVSGCHQPAGQHRYGEYPPDTRSQATIQQGVWGNVWFWEGDFMPPVWGTITPVSRTVYAYELTSYDQVKQVPYSSFFWSINSQLVAVTTSNSTGFFQMELPPGRYSFFVREGSQFYANGDDGKYIMPAAVETGLLTKVQIDITYNACF